MMRPGPPSAHGLNDNMPSGYEGMNPGNQGVANIHNGGMTGGMTEGSFARPDGEQQMERAMYQSRQLAERNREGAAVYAQNTLLGQARQGELIQADKDNKVNVGLNAVLSDIIAHDDRIPTNGAGLMIFDNAIKSEPDHLRRIAKGRSQGMA